MRNPTCCHIVFGACHDNGYVRLLEDFLEDPAVVNRITLLHSFSVGKEFQRLPFRSITMNSVFRTSSPEVSRIATSNNSHGVSATMMSHNTTGHTWTSRATVEGKSNEDSTHKKVLSRRILVNAIGQRVDERLSHPSQAATDSWNHKTKVVKMRYCRTYQLSGSCPGSCGYSHGLLSDDEKLVYRLILRREVCHTGLKCRDWRCHYGHNCFCKKQSCKFTKDMHTVNNATAEVVVEES